jgi:hypothetical protein
VIDVPSARAVIQTLLGAQILDQPEALDQLVEQLLATEPGNAFAVTGGLAGMLANACRGNHICGDPECRELGLIPLVYRRNPDGSPGEQVSIDVLPPPAKAFARMASAASRSEIPEMHRLFYGFVQKGQDGDRERARALLRFGVETVASLLSGSVR